MLKASVTAGPLGDNSHRIGLPQCVPSIQSDCARGITRGTLYHESDDDESKCRPDTGQVHQSSVTQDKLQVYALHGDSIFFEGRMVSCIE